MTFTIDFFQCSVSEIYFINIPPHSIPLPAGERGRVRGNYLEFLNKYPESVFAYSSK
jgi:hypothetical protein